MKSIFLLVLACTITLSSTSAIAQRRHHTSASRSTSTAKTGAELNAGRAKVAAQIKVLTRFLYLFGGVAKTIQSADLAIHDGAASPVAVENQQSKAKIVTSIRQLHDGLDKLEADFSSNQSLRNYYAYVLGVAAIADTAQSQAAANHFDQAGSTLLKAVDQLTDALAAMR